MVFVELLQIHQLQVTNLLQPLDVVAHLEGRRNT
jgi:hypothetical protein